jgi:hypothetical protein
MTHFSKTAGDKAITRELLACRRVLRVCPRTRSGGSPDPRQGPIEFKIAADLVEDPIGTVDGTKNGFRTDSKDLTANRLLRHSITYLYLMDFNPHYGM